jgi:hypothetical protein
VLLTSCADLCAAFHSPLVIIPACSSLARTHTWQVCLSFSSSIHICAQIGWVQTGVLSPKVCEDMNKLHNKMLPSMAAGHYVHSKATNIKTKYLQFNKKHTHFEGAWPSQTPDPCLSLIASLIVPPSYPAGFHSMPPITTADGGTQKRPTHYRVDTQDEAELLKAFIEQVSGEWVGEGYC